MQSCIEYDDGSVEQSYLSHMFYLASLGFNIVPGGIIIGGVRVDYKAIQEGIKLTKNDGESMVLPFEAAIALVSIKTKPNK